MAKTKKPSKSDEREAFLIKVGNSNAKRLRTNATKWERIIYRYLKELGVHFKFQDPIVIRKKYLYIMDFFIPDKDMCIEIDSKQHHTSKEDVKKDRIRTRRLKSEGIFVIRLWNSHISVMERDTLKKMLEIPNPLKTVKNSSNI